MDLNGDPLTLASLILLGGSLGDRYGRRFPACRDLLVHHRVIAVQRSRPAPTR